MSSPEYAVAAALPPAAKFKASETRPSLLPPFEPCSSSPSLPRPPKRKHDGSPSNDRLRLKFYPTPAPTSTTGVLPSSPPHASSTRTGLQRTVSTMSERVPLGTVLSVNLPFNGDPMLMGRSSNSSHYQLSANRLISRIHVRATYRAPSELHEFGEILLECLGWNGARVHCRGKAYELSKGDSFSSDKPQAEIMLDVQDARVLVKWPTLQRRGSLSASPNPDWDDEDSPVRVETPSRFTSSPPQALAHLQSPISPSPRDRINFTASSTFLGMPAAPSPTRASVEVYEDNASDLDPQPVASSPPLPNFLSAASVPESSHKSPALSEVESFSDNDEENDPIVHSFGPYGANLQARMASITAGSPPSRRRPLKASVSPVQHAHSTSLPSFDTSSLRNHVINQLAFSRLHSLPLSTIMNNLPATLKGIKKADSSDDVEDVSKPKLTDEDLKKLLDEIPCVGEIVRAGKDAAGKVLEDEFYYMPEKDTDEMRRDAVEQKPGLRAVRKQHKQYYWKRPRY